MTLQWVLLLVLVTTLIAAEKGSYEETGNDLLRWLDNSGRGFGTWRSPQEDEDEELEYPANIFKNENRKRALSFLTHWRPWNQLSGNGRHVIRSPFSSFFPDTDVPSKGNRPVGQPLRWGRRRRR
ncbi:uncharacterized protein LOC132943299 [Metopolophium dirhodum]|uniref:uncharacterized protein LOC132943299 n=1 Tax=Metopolophium dirhodum TaxID=44670 RepID=UPI00298FE787|nr:uncharacterized protein LOC132943299 [Metopolophium dirhodum]